MRQKAKSNKGLWPALVLTALFVVAQAAVTYYNGSQVLSLVPIGLLVVWLYTVRLEWGLMLMALCTPFAVNMTLIPGMQLSMPVEPMMILFCFFFLFRVLVAKTYDVSVLRHPVSLLLLAQLVWWLVTCCTSRMPWVSFKYLASRLWFVIPFFFAAVPIFRNHRRISQFYWAYAIGLGVVILIATTKTLGNFSDLQTLHRVMRPFYNDHTAYGCAIALMLPASVHFIFSKKHQGWVRVLTLLLMAGLIVGLFFSYCRAAWISVVVAAGVYLLIRMGMKVKWMVVLAGLAVGAFFAYQSDVLYKLGKNHQDSSYTLADQVKSISNISTDASNVERLNRWASAMRLWKESPILGIGPGTYQFQYGSYQKSYQLSTISTNAGDLGNAHSEYIGPMTEQGIVGVGLVVAVFLATFATGVRVYRTAADSATGRMALAFTLSLLTYYVHGMFNNFLDTDKLSVPFWGFTAVVVALDLYSTKREA